jgi:hypothetical protein
MKEDEKWRMAIWATAMDLMARSIPTATTIIATDGGANAAGETMTRIGEGSAMTAIMIAAEE